MKAASINELKKQLATLPADELVELCTRLAKFKKENKELLNYLLFESTDEAAYIQLVKDEMVEAFYTVHKTNLYFAKKNLRKILRTTNKYIKYTGSKEAEVELLSFFCVALQESGIRINSSTALYNLYHAQIKKIEKTIAGMHEDLQYDYQKTVQVLKEFTG